MLDFLSRPLSESKSVIWSRYILLGFMGNHALDGLFGKTGFTLLGYAVFVVTMGPCIALAMAEARWSDEYEW